MAPGFRALLRSHDLDDLEARTGAVYGTWPDFRLAYMNPAWFHFARDNGGEPQISARWGLGRSLLDCAAGRVRKFLEAGLGACLESGEVWAHDYECSSASLFRRFHQVVYPLGAAQGLLIVNACRIERPHDPAARPAHAAEAGEYTDDDGLISQCAHCRRVQHARDPGRWDWVPEWVRRCPYNTSHTFCPECLGHYYPLPPGRGASI